MSWLVPLLNLLHYQWPKWWEINFNIPVNVIFDSQIWNFVFLPIINIGKQVINNILWNKIGVVHIVLYSKYTRGWAKTQHIFYHVKFFGKFCLTNFSWTAEMFSQSLENNTCYQNHHHNLKREEVNLQHNNILSRMGRTFILSMKENIVTLPLCPN